MLNKETLHEHEQSVSLELIKTMRDSMFGSAENMETLIKVIEESGP
jgi:hypothetical protein